MLQPCWTDGHILGASRILCVISGALEHTIIQKINSFKMASSIYFCFYACISNGQCFIQRQKPVSKSVGCKFVLRIRIIMPLPDGVSLLATFAAEEIRNTPLNGHAASPLLYMCVHAIPSWLFSTPPCLELSGECCNFLCIAPGREGWFLSLPAWPLRLFYDGKLI